MEVKPKSIYNKYAIYLIGLPQDYPDPNYCPKCRGNLIKTECHPSNSVGKLLGTVDYHIYCSFSYGRTYLMVCDQCQWWYIREAFGGDDITRCYDYLIYGIEDSETQLKAGYITPWDQVLSDVIDLYPTNPSELPDDIRNMMLWQNLPRISNFEFRINMD
jgi:hypothetical protein